MRLIYIAGHYRGDGKPNTIHDNIEKARAVALKYWKQGFAVICPHTNTAYFDGACKDNVWLKGDIEILKRCDIIVMMKGWETSAGACEEHAHANNSNIEVIYE